MNGPGSSIFNTLGLFTKAVFVRDEVLALAAEQKQELIATSGLLEGANYPASNCSIWALLEKRIVFTSPGTLLYHDTNLKELVVVAGSTIQLYERKDDASLTYQPTSRHKAGTFIPTRALLVKENKANLLVYIGLSNNRSAAETESSLYISKTDYKSPSRLVKLFYGYGVFNLTTNKLVTERITPIKRKSPILDLLYDENSRSLIIKYINHTAEQLVLTIDLDQSYTLVAQQGQNIEYTNSEGTLVYPVRCPQEQTTTLPFSFIGSPTKPEVDAVHLSISTDINLDLFTCNLTCETLYHIYFTGLGLSVTNTSNIGCGTALQETFKDTIGFLSPDRKVLFLHNKITKVLSYTTIGEIRNRVRMALSAQAVCPWTEEHRVYFESFPIRQMPDEVGTSFVKLSAKEYTQYRVHLLSLVHNTAATLSTMSLTQNSMVSQIESGHVQAQDELIKAMSKKIEELETKLEQSMKVDANVQSSQLVDILEKTQKRVDDIENMIANIHEDGILAVPDAVENIYSKISTLEQREKELKELVDLNNSIVQSKLLKVDSQIAVLDQSIDEVKNIVPVFDESFSEEEVASLCAPDRATEDIKEFVNNLEAEHLILQFDDMEFERNSTALPFCVDTSEQRGNMEPASLLTTEDL